MHLLPPIYSTDEFKAEEPDALNFKKSWDKKNAGGGGAANHEPAQKYAQ